VLSQQQQPPPLTDAAGAAAVGSRRRRMSARDRRITRALTISGEPELAPRATGAAAAPAISPGDRPSGLPSEP
jgi:hypothetical protein